MGRAAGGEASSHIAEESSEKFGRPTLILSERDLRGKWLPVRRNPWCVFSCAAYHNANVPSRMSATTRGRGITVLSSVQRCLLVATPSRFSKPTLVRTRLGGCRLKYRWSFVPAVFTNRRHYSDSFIERPAAPSFRTLWMEKRCKSQSL